MAILLFCWPLTAWVLLQPLERPYPPQKFPREAGEQAIVVLSSSIYFPSVPALPAPRVGSDTYERCEYAAWLFKNWKPLPIVVSGGPNPADVDAPPYAVTMRTELVKEGVPDAAIASEEKSQSTHENAVYTAALLRQKGIGTIVLVTDAYHMTRAKKSFERQGLKVVPAACGYRSFHKIFLETLLPGWEAILFNEGSLHEYIGLAWYRIHGWI